MSIKTNFNNRRQLLSHSLDVGNFMKTCGIGFKTTHSNNLKKKHMLTNRIKEVQEYVNEDPIYDKEPEMELVRKNSEFERKIKQGRKAKEIIEKRNLNFVCHQI